MAYYIDLFSPETYKAFEAHGCNISGFRERHRSAAQNVRPGDKFICYVTGFSRWVGVLEVLEGPFTDQTPIFYSSNDPFIVRFRVRPIVWLPLEKGIPISHDEVWQKLSFTAGLPPGSMRWTAMVRQSLRRLQDSDGAFLEDLLKRHEQSGESFPIDAKLAARVALHRVKRPDREVDVTVPERAAEEESGDEVAPPAVRESTRIQALLAKVGAEMGFQIWVPQVDRSRVLEEWPQGKEKLLERLPLSYDEATMKTIEQIDVLWVKGHSIRRAFEVEHTTSVYSGLLRMADLLALQPNLAIKLHIVAPSSRRDKVLRELRRPVFKLIQPRPLAEQCTYLSYESVQEIAQNPHLRHLSETVLEEYEEECEP